MGLYCYTDNQPVVNKQVQTDQSMVNIQLQMNQSVVDVQLQMDQSVVDVQLQTDQSMANIQSLAHHEMNHDRVQQPQTRIEYTAVCNTQSPVYGMLVSTACLDVVV